MAAKILKYAAIPAAAVVGLGSFRIYSVTEKTNEELISPKELSIYSPDGHAVQFVEEEPGVLQTGLGSVRVGLQPYVRAMQSGFTSVKVGLISVYQTGQDTYHFLQDPPPGFLPRVAIIGVSGLGGLILARKGSRLKRIVVPLGLASAGTAVCYPTQTVGALKITGKKVYAVSSSVASMFKSKPKEDLVMSAVSTESAATVTIPDTESPTKALSELPPESEAAPAAPEEDVTPVLEVVPSVELTPAADVVPPPPVVDVASGTAAPPSEPEPTPAPALETAPITETTFVPVDDTTPESIPEPSPEPVPETVKESVPESLEAPVVGALIDAVPESAPSSETDPEIVPEAAPAPPELEIPAPMDVIENTTPTLEETTPSVLSDDTTPTTVDEAHASVAPPPAEEAIALTPPLAEASQPTADEALPSSEPPAAEPPTVKSRFVPDPSLLDHGQSNPEDADMYSTRS